ncbi:MAG: hypothetical protein HGA90_03425, partial [Alphaproteobacteria bacterium]|nr:hypothetical protein [Alphaproteobacteria bacterium]
MTEPASPSFSFADLPPRRETFLARYPRDWKLAVTFGLLVLLIAPWFLLGEKGSSASGGASSASDYESMSQTLSAEGVAASTVKP